MVDDDSADRWLARARTLLPAALSVARSAQGFASRWASIAAKIELLPQSLSDLSTHPCFSKTPLCREQLQLVSAALSDAVVLADARDVGKLRMQSDLDALTARLELCLRDCRLLVKSGVLGDAAPSGAGDVGELVARLQIGDAEARHRAVDGLLEALRADEKGAITALGRGSVAALAKLLSATAPKVKEKAAVVICLLAECGDCESLLISEGAIPALLRLVESGCAVAREKSVVSLHKLSANAGAACLIVEHGGVRPLIEACKSGDPVVQSPATTALKNLSTVLEIKQSLADSGIIRAMISLLDDDGGVSGLKEHAAECLQNMTSGDESLKSLVVCDGGVQSLLAYLDGPLPQEPAVAAIRNLIGSVSVDSLVSLGLLPRLVHVLKDGTPGAKQAVLSTICKISSSPEAKKLIGEFGIMPLLIILLEAKMNATRELAAHAIASLMACPQNRREVKKNERSVPSLVQLLDSNPQNTAKKYAVACLLYLSSSKKCKRMMISHGAIGYLKKLTEMDAPGAKKLLERMERGQLKSLFSKS